MGPVISVHERERFAEQLVRLVRDRAIDSCDQLVSGAIGGPVGDRWRDTVADEAAKTAVRELIPDIVDQVVFQLLDAIDNDQLSLAWRKADESFAALEEIGEGEMAGWFMMGPGGWLDRYSSQRYFDPASSES